MTRLKNALTDMLERMEQADIRAKAGDPAGSLKILMGWTCGQCRLEFTPRPEDEPLLAVRLTTGLPILCGTCAPKEGRPR